KGGGAGGAGGQQTQGATGTAGQTKTKLAARGLVPIRRAKPGEQPAAAIPAGQGSDAQATGAATGHGGIGEVIGIGQGISDAIDGHGIGGVDRSGAWIGQRVKVLGVSGTWLGV